MTCPTRKPITPSFPSRNFCAASSLPAKTSSTMAPSSPLSETWRRPLRSTMSSIDVAGLDGFLERLLGAGAADRVVADEREQVGQVARRDPSRGLGAVLVREARQVLRDPVGGPDGVGAERHGLVEERRGRAVAHEHARDLGLQPVLGYVALAPRSRQLGQRGPQLLDELAPTARSPGCRARGSTGSRRLPPWNASSAVAPASSFQWRVSCTIVSPASSALVCREIS